jgi:hypothetical protein
VRAASENPAPPAPLTLAVVIAMPDAARGARKPDDDAPPPYCELGLARVRMPDGVGELGA